MGCSSSKNTSVSSSTLESFVQLGKGLSAVEVLDSIHSGKKTSVQVVQAYLDRIDAVNPKINACIEVLREDAIAQAAESDKRIAAGTARPLEGLPYLVKANIEQEGKLNTCSVVTLKDWRPKQDAPIITAMKEAGAIVIARTNMSEAARHSNGYSPVHGITRNPFDLNRNSGGSSAGTGAGIGSGMASCGLGTDTFGSCRIPAMCCGGTGMKPSRGRYSNEGILPCLSDFDQSGPFGVTVADLALLDSVLSGLPKVMPRANLNGVTFGSPSDWFPEKIAAENKQALDVAIKAAVNIGGTLNDSAFHKEFDKKCVANTAMLNYTYREVNEYLANRAPELNMKCEDLKSAIMDEFSWKDTMKGKTQEEIEERDKKVADEKALQEEKYLKVFTDQKIDFMIVPSAGCEPHKYDGDWSQGAPKEHTMDSEWVPSIVIQTPIRSPNGLPCSVLVFGKPNGDSELLEFAQTLDKEINKR